MCRGLALGFHVESKKVICKGLSSHTETLRELEDECIKLEIIATDTVERNFLLELDEQYADDKWVREKFKGWITKAGSISKRLNDCLENWISNNEIFIYKSLVNLQSHAIREKGIDNFCQKSKSYINNYYQRAKGGIINDYQISTMINNSYQKSKGYINNSYQHAKDNIYNSHQVVGREYYLQGLTLKKYPNTTKLIKTCKPQNSIKFTIVELINYIISNPEKCKEIMGKEFVDREEKTND
jgi:hypothetical protein